MTRLLGKSGRLRMAWYVLRGHTVIYRATIRNGGLDLRDHPKAIVQEVSIFGAVVAHQVGEPPEPKHHWNWYLS